MKREPSCSIQTDMMKLTVAFHNFANVTKNNNRVTDM